MKAAFTYSHERKDAKRSGESIRCHSCHGFGHTGVRGVRQKIPGAAAEQKPARKHSANPQELGESHTGGVWESLTPCPGLGCHYHLTLPHAAFLPSAFPKPSSPTAALLHLLTPQTVPENPLLLSGAAFCPLHHHHRRLYHGAAQQTPSPAQDLAYLSPSRTAQAGILSARNRMSEKPSLLVIRGIETTNGAQEGCNPSFKPERGIWLPDRGSADESI